MKGKSSASGSVLSKMSPEARSRFAERANVAQERRHEMAMKSQQKQRQRDIPRRTTKKITSHSAKKAQSSFSYWLLHASLKEIFLMLFFGKSKRA